MTTQPTHALRPLILAGFMGAGKSTVGPLLARRLGWQFIDLDQHIETACRQSIAEIFESQGDAGFRALEAQHITYLLHDPRTVLALGGGALTQPAVRAAIAYARARTVWLKVDFQTALGRLDATARQSRPNLTDLTQAAALHREREATYATCELTVDTNGQTPEAVCEVLMHTIDNDPAIADVAHTLRVSAGAGDYDVALSQQGTAWVAAALRARLPHGHIALVTDATVGPLHAQPLLAALQHLGAQVSLHVVPVGEQSKSLAQASALYDAMLGLEIGRSDALAAVGGGVVGDLTGFVASTYMRGIAYVQVPTTTLAAVDSSVGGKTAVNTPRGKNLIGTFYPPHGVYLALPYLLTQGARQHAAGLVEAFKMAATHDAGLFAHMQAATTDLLAFAPEVTLDVLARAIAIKAGVVSRDEREASERATLNLGHTIGHAIEVGEAYRLLHGEAVALGILAEVAFAEAAGLCDAEVGPAFQRAFAALNLPTQWARAKLDVAAMRLDKKRQGAQVLLPVVDRLGHCVLHRVPMQDLTDFLNQRP